MADNRELILSRIKAIAAEMEVATPGTFNTIARNRGLLKNDVLPAFVVMDGDERNKLSGAAAKEVRMTVQLVTMRPQLFVVMDQRQPANALTGEDLNRLRMALITAVSQDTTLLDLLGANGQIAYDGCETDLKSGSQGLGQMRLDFSITYKLDPYA